MEKIMNIVVASDENYVPHLETLLVSIGENNMYEELIEISILDSGLSERTKNWITGLSNRYRNLLFEFVQMTEKDIENKIGGGKIGRDRSLSAYSRIFIPELVNAKRALYLDVDAIVVSDLRELSKINLDGYAIAGVKDSNPIGRHRNVGLEDSDVYINSGMILWNLEKCREIDAVGQFIEFLHKHNGQVDAMDQGTINGVLGKQGLIKIIHPKFNAFTSLFQLKSEEIQNIYQLPDYYVDKEIEEARNNPVFIHFTPNMTTRPWVRNCIHPYKNKYWDYRMLTQFCEKKLDADKRSFKLRILGFLYRKQPFMYYRLCSLNHKRFI